MDVSDLRGYITIRMAAQQLGTTPAAIYAYLRRHNVPTGRAGRTLLLKLYDLCDMRVRIGERAWKAL